MSKLGDKIKEIRIKNNMTQEDFANIMGYTDKSSIAKIEKGVNDMAFDKLEFLINKFELDIDDLFNNLDNKEEDRTEKVELTVLCLIEDNNKILLQNRIKKDWQGYTLPGGHVEIGESFVNACIREVKEETGLDIKNPKLVGVKQFPIKRGRYIVFLFKTNEFSGTVASSDEGKMEWIEYSDIYKIDTVDDLDKLLRVMNSNELNEFQYVVKDNIWRAILK